jgi:hypothetical protein
MMSPGAPWSGWRGFQPVKVASGPERAVEHREGQLAAAVGDVEQERAVAARAVARPQQIEVRRALHESRAVPGRAVEVGDLRVERMHGIDAEAQGAIDLLVAAGWPEGPAAEHGLAPRDVNAHEGHCYLLFADHYDTLLPTHLA